MASRFRAQRGFTLIEALVATLVGVIALLGLYELVDTSNKLTKQQTEVADVQQSARIGLAELSRVIRQSRIGGLYYGNAVLPIANNSPSGASLQPLSGLPHFIRQGTDMIEVRGVISGDRYILDEGNVTCGGTNCAISTSITVRIPWKAALGFVNFPYPVTGAQPPSLVGKTRKFYFVVQDGQNQQVTVGGLTYLMPIYVVGLVNPTTPCTVTSATWCTLTKDPDPACDGNPFRVSPPCTSFLTFNMDPTDSGAMELNAPWDVPFSTKLAKSLAGGAVDVVRFFVDEGTVPPDPRLDTHPSLAEASFDPQTGNWDIQPLVEEVEDFQIAYGVDGADGVTPHDGGVSPGVVNLTGANRDEWVGDFAGEVPTPSGAPPHVDAFIDTSIPSGPPDFALAIPALRSVWISLVVKSTNPDFVYDGPGARGIQILDSRQILDSKTFSAATGRPYRRRALSLAVSLRNNSLINLPTPVPTP